MRRFLYIIYICLLAGAVHAQIGDEAYSFLRLPTSTHANAIGGHTVSLVEADPSLGFHNPALLGGEMDNMLNLNYMNYISDVNVGSTIYTKAFKDKGAWGVGASFFSYGNIQEYSEENQYLGDISAKDIAVQGFFSYDLSEKWRGGLSLKLLYSTMADYNSFGLGVDAGLSYYDSEKKFSFGFVLKNVGAQLKAYYDERQKMPWDIQLGITKQMEHAPIRFSLTAMYFIVAPMTMSDAESVPVKRTPILSSMMPASMRKPQTLSMYSDAAYVPNVPDVQPRCDSMRVWSGDITSTNM